MLQLPTCHKTCNIFSIWILHEAAGLLINHHLKFALLPLTWAACFTLHAETISQPPKPESICHKAVVHSLPRLGPTRCQRAPGCAPCSVGDEQWPGQHVLRVSWPWDPHRAVMILQTLQHSHCSDCIMHWEQAFFMFGISCNEFSYIKSWLNHTLNRSSSMI